MSSPKPMLPAEEMFVRCRGDAVVVAVFTTVVKRKRLHEFSNTTPTLMGGLARHPTIESAIKETVSRPIMLGEIQAARIGWPSERSAARRDLKRRWYLV